MLALSVLDQSPVPDGWTPADAVRQTLALAELCDRLGYRRYWLAEHHNTRGLAGSAPEILIGHVAARTKNMRVGSGGVMLSHYSALKVAETFRVLEALHPGRIDLGLGRAPGSDQLTAAALQPSGAGFSTDQFPQQVADLIGFLRGDLDAKHPFARVRAMPSGEGVPDLWLLGSSTAGASYAASFGLAFSFAHFINPWQGPRIMDAYRRVADPSAPTSIGVSVICAETDDDALRLSWSQRLWRLRLERGDPGPVPTVEDALAYPYTEDERERVEHNAARLVVGSPETCRTQLEALAAAYGVDEIVVVTIVHNQQARLRSYELLADVFELSNDGVGSAHAEPQLR
jgi:luciferase family oxidoreductase group 1